jgi:hypothetical protein
VVGRLAGAVALGEVGVGGATTQPPEAAVERGAFLVSPAAGLARWGGKGLSWCDQDRRRGRVGRTSRLVGCRRTGPPHLSPASSNDQPKGNAQAIAPPCQPSGEAARARSTADPAPGEHRVEPRSSPSPVCWPARTPGCQPKETTACPHSETGPSPNGGANLPTISGVRALEGQAGRPPSTGMGRML